MRGLTAYEEAYAFPEAFVVDVMRLISFLEGYNLGGYGNALRGQIHSQIDVADHPV